MIIQYLFQINLKERVLKLLLVMYWLRGGFLGNSHRGRQASFS